VTHALVISLQLLPMSTRRPCSSYVYHFHSFPSSADNLVHPSSTSVSPSP
jgi:hypothetical protein